MKLEIFDYHKIFPFKSLGLTAPFWTVHIDTLIYTWLSMAVLAAFVFFMRSRLRDKRSLAVIAGEFLVETFVNLFQESVGWFSRKACGFVLGLFMFTVACNLIALFPFIEEPTRDLNTTLALAICSFFYVQIQGVASHGLKHFKEFIEPVWFLLPLNVVSESAKILSMSFRLFGNILAGSIIIMLITHFLMPLAPYYLATLAACGLYLGIMHLLPRYPFGKRVLGLIKTTPFKYLELGPDRKSVV